jgi:predicted nucleotidyltransferase
VADGITVLKAPRQHTLEEIARLAAGPLAAAGAERAVVFGSWARGTADGFSDLDLAVVLSTALPFLERGGLLGELVRALPIGVDLLVYTPEEFKRGMETRRGVFDAVAREGVTIYARSEG